MRPAKSNASECVKHLDNLIVIVGGLSRKLPGSTMRVKLEIDTKKQINIRVSPFVCSNEADSCLF